MVAGGDSWCLTLSDSPVLAQQDPGCGFLSIMMVITKIPFPYK